MALHFQRWNLIDEDGRVTAVIRMVGDGRVLSDEGHADCFSNTACAAEAAWLYENEPPPRGTWLEAADRVMASEPVDAVGPRDKPRPRIIDMDMIAHGDVKWMELAAGQGLAATMSFEKMAPIRAPAGGLDAFLSDDLDDDAPLSGHRTAEWALAEVAGVKDPAPPPTTDPLGTVSDGPLSGEQTRDWKLVDFAKVATGGPREDED